MVPWKIVIRVTLKLCDITIEFYDLHISELENLSHIFIPKVESMNLKIVSLSKISFYFSKKLLFYKEEMARGLFYLMRFSVRKWQ